MAETIVINSGPLITFSRMDALRIIAKLPYNFVTPGEVRDELKAKRDGLLDDSFVSSVVVKKLVGPRISALFSNLDSGEAAVIQLALEQGIERVCLDERKGRRIAIQNDLSLLGSLGLLGRAKKLGIISEIRPYIKRAINSGVHYEMGLIERFLEEIGED